MSEDESSYPEDWFEIGDKDLRRAGDLLALKDAEAAGFFVQQAVEKYLKGFLLSKGWRLRRIHDLETLLNDAIDFEPSFEEFLEECLKITDYYFSERYPNTARPDLTEEDVKNSLQAARKIIERIQRLIGTNSADREKQK